MTLKNMTLQDFYDLGQRCRSLGYEGKDDFYRDSVDYEFFVAAELGIDLSCDYRLMYEVFGRPETKTGLFFNAGLHGQGIPPYVSGWRYGDLPDENFGTRCSYNTRDQAWEAGVSLAALDGEPRTESFAVWASEGRPVVRVRGYLSYLTGGDGEPLIVGAEVI